MTKLFLTFALLLTALAAIPAIATAAPAERSCGITGPGSYGLGVLASKQTSCPFAKSIGRMYLAAPSVRLSPGMYGPRPATFSVYSSAAHRTITMRCRLVMTQDSPYGLCTGGNGARVRIVS